MRRCSRRLMLFVLGLLVAGIPGPARATVIDFLDEATLARQAQSIVRGKVVARSVVTLDGRLWTDSTVVVTEVLKGRLGPGARMLVRQPGGERAGLGMRVAGAATFSLGEEVLLFARWAAGRHQPVGMAQGKYTLYRDGTGGLRARRDVSGLGVTSVDARGRVSVRASSPAPDRWFEELRASVRGALTGGGR